jgi:hypothetical protein
VRWPNTSWQWSYLEFFWVGGGSGLRFSWEDYNVEDYRLMVKIGGSEVLLPAWTPTADTWHHIVLQRTGTTLEVCADGVSIGTTTNSTNMTYTAAPQLCKNLHDSGYTYLAWFDEMRVTKGEANYVAPFTPPTAPFPEGEPPPEYDIYSAAPSPLGAPAIVVRNDISGFLDGLRYFDLYLLDVVTPTGTVRVPMSSWQATLQSSLSNFLQAVVPAVDAYAEAVSAATSIVITRRAVAPDGTVLLDSELMRGPINTVRFDRGPYRHTATMSGYWDGFAADTDPPETFDRALVGVRSRSSTESGRRVRCAIDWLLRPSQRAFDGETQLLVRLINYYASTSDAYMDVSE